MMKTAEQILKAKGYNNDEINDIINFGTRVTGPNGLDMKVRAEFGLDGEPLHLWEAYYIGDANEETVHAKAAELSYDDVDSLLSAMDARLAELCEAVPEKAAEQ